MAETRLLDNPYVRVTTNFVHDMSTGTWAACVLVLWSLARSRAGMPPEAAAAIADAAGAVFWLLIASLIGLTVTGGLRLFYWRSDTPPEQLAAKRGALIVKHVVFLVVYGAGSFWAWTLVGS
ncbi:MAG: hypothetical protein HGB10_09590 [Coriobacteriia bacterium]|nr:hypothetical protein [Coriobacteriia bacterium]